MKPSETIHKEILEKIAEGKINGDSQKINSPGIPEEIKYQAIKDLNDDGFIKGIDCSSKSGKEWISLQIIQTPLTSL